MKNLITLSFSLLLVMSCTSDDGLRDVYIEIEAENPSVNTGEMEIYLYDMNSSGPSLFIVASEAPVTKTSDSYSYPVGSNLTLNRASASFDQGLTWWANTKITVYSNGKKILTEIYDEGDNSLLQNKNIIID